MKYLKLFENFNKSEIDDICEKYNIENYTINPDGSIDVEGNVFLYSRNLTKLPLKFNKVDGYFNCSSNRLTNLEGCPKEVGTNFYCHTNRLTSLMGCPIYVNDFCCSGNKLTNLIGCPTNVEYFDCAYNNLTSIDGYPKDVCGYFDFRENPIEPIIHLFMHHCEDIFNYDVRVYLEYQETYNFLRKDCKIVKHLLIEAIKDYNEYYNKQVELPKEIEGYTYI
jgi:hypothetical protein